MPATKTRREGMIRDISFAIMDRLPPLLAMTYGESPNRNWIRHSSDNHEDDAILFRLYSKRDYPDREWWVVIRAFPLERKLEHSTSYLRQKALGIFSYNPRDQVSDDRIATGREFLDDVANRLERYSEDDNRAPQDILALSLFWCKPITCTQVTNALYTTDWFSQRHSECFVSLASSHDDFEEVAIMAAQCDRLCAGYLFKSRWKRVLADKGILVVARPWNTANPDERLPVIGYGGIISSRRSSGRMYYLCSLAVEPEFRRMGIGTNILHTLRMFAKVPLVTILPQSYKEGLQFLKNYGTTSVLARSANIPELRHVDWDAYRFEVPPPAVR